jgi:hypothetical protein
VEALTVETFQAQETDHALKTISDPLRQVEIEKPQAKAEPYVPLDQTSQSSSEPHSKAALLARSPA